MSQEAIFHDLLDDTRCERCARPKPSGRQCLECFGSSRHNSQRATVEEWLAEELPSEAELNSANPLVRQEARRHRRMLLAAAGSALNRSMTLNGVRDRPIEDGGTVSDNHRADFANKFGRPKSNGRSDMEARWRRPQSIKTSRADAEPA